MTRFKSMLAQIVLWAPQMLNIWAPFIPPAANKYVILGLGTISVISAKKTSESNPDGTPSAVAYEDKKSN